MAELLTIERWPVWANSLLLLLTIAMVVQGAHWVVESACRIAKRLGISELVIGLTVVALGTSAPEFGVTLTAALQGHGDISVGNIVGSNIFNLGFILGGTALVRAIPTTPTIVWRDMAVLAGATLLILLFIGLNQRLDRWEGALLFAGLVAYLVYLFVSRKAAPEREEEVSQILAAERPRPLWSDCIMLVVGLGCIVGGSHLLVLSASAIARAFGLSEWVIAVTIVAAGTSAPEFVVSLVGVLKGRYEMSAGNVVGSDLFNVLGVLGLSGALSPMEVDPAARASLMALSGMVFLVLIFMRTGWRVSRLEGLALVLVARHTEEAG